MIVSHKHKFIFIKTRKTAGTSIEVFLSEVCGEKDILTPIIPEEEGHKPRNHEGFFNHMSGEEVRSKVGEEVWGSYFKFCVERNPWDKVVSSFFWSKPSFDFNSFIRNSELPLDSRLYLDAGGNMAVDRVILYESLNEGLKDVLSGFGVAFEGLSVRAKSNSRTEREYRKMYDEDGKSLIEGRFKKEIEMFGFEF